MPDDADLYYRRTHDGQLPPPGVDTSDHSAEATNIVATTNLTTGAGTKTVRSNVVLYNGVDPANLGKGDWIWQMSTCISSVGAADVQGLIDYEKNKGMQWITVKCGDGSGIYPSSGSPQFTADLVNRAHAAGLKIFGWAYVYGANVAGEIAVANNCLSLGADGFIIDAETEYENLANNSAAATTYCQGIRAAYPTRFLAHAPYPIISSHSGFPYIAFGTNCDAVMPQAYWADIGGTNYAVTMVTRMNSEWRTWQNGLTGFNTNAIKPIVPIGQGYNSVNGLVDGWSITNFINALKTNSPAATAGGYRGVSWWSCQHHGTSPNKWPAIGNTTLGNLPPNISSTPSSRTGDLGSTINLRVAADGSPTLKYQWRLNGTNVPAATNNTLTVAGLQAANGGSYTVVITNLYGSLTSSVAILTVNPLFTPIFADNFDTNSAANWTLNRSSTTNTRISFAYDYSGLGIAAAPNATGGITKAVRFEANLFATNTAALNISPIGKSFGGNYRLHFDMWINANGPFPDGGTGSTEHLTAGLATAGTQVQWNSGGADGVWFATDGEGQATDTSATLPDWRAYAGTTLQNTNTGVYSAGTDADVRGNGHPYYENVFPGGQPLPAGQVTNYPQQTGALAVGTVGFAWRDVVINKTGSNVEWFIDGLKIAAITNATLTASNIFVGYWDSFTSVSDNTNLSFALVDNLRVEVPATAPLLTTNPLARTVKLGTNVTFTAAASGLPAPNYQWRLNGTNIFGATNSSYALAFVAATNTGNYSILATNIAGSVVSTNALLALVSPVAAQFTAIALAADSVQISFNGDAYWTYTIETSTNLVSWNTLTNLISPDGLFNFTAGSATNDLQRFYRARVGP